MNILDVTAQSWVITIVGWMIVFVGLVVLIIVFTYVPKLLNIKFGSNPKKNAEGTEKVVDNSKYISGDETAAIAMALHLFFDEQHDTESNIITIKRIERRYSPWSSKIYGMRNFPK